MKEGAGRTVEVAFAGVLFEVRVTCDQGQLSVEVPDVVQVFNGEDMGAYIAERNVPVVDQQHHTRP